jgi:hypothetical protein
MTVEAPFVRYARRLPDGGQGRRGGLPPAERASLVVVPGDSRRSANVGAMELGRVRPR